MTNIVTNRKIKTKLFPKTQDYDKLLIDTESISYISSPYYADNITNIIIKHLNDYNLESNNIIITDLTAGTGGNTISFAKNFKMVNAIELDKNRYNYLNNNINTYNLTNVNTYNDNCINILDNFNKSNVIFIDPPWGGKKYKMYFKIRLNICSIPIETICNNYITHSLTHKLPNLIVLKLPTNYDITYFYNTLFNKKIYLYEIHKIFLLVICN